MAFSSQLSFCFDEETEQPASSDDLPTLSEVIERVGFGWAQVRCALIGGSVWLADGAEILLIGTVTRAVSQELELTDWERGFIVSVVFAGLLLGNIISGSLSDSLGRRMPIIICYFGIFVFSVLTSMTKRLSELYLLRLLLGVSFGIGQPAFGALSTEVTPASWRIPMAAFGQIGFAVGEMYSSMLVYYDDPSMKDLDWRWLIRAGALPALVFGIAAWLFLRQSVMWLNLQGQYDEAKCILQAIAADNGKGDLSIDFKAAVAIEEPSSPGGAVARQVSTVFSKYMAFSTVTLMYSCFVLNAIFFGCVYAFPQVVRDTDMGVAPAIALFLGAAWEIPGDLLAIACGLYLERKPVIYLYLILTTLCLVLFTLGARGGQTYLFYFLQLGFYGLKVFPMLGCIVLYQYASEVFPTIARSMGTGMCLAGGRIGGFVVPIMYEVMHERTGSFEGFFWLLAGLTTINAVLVAFMPDVDVKNLQERLQKP